MDENEYENEKREKQGPSRFEEMLTDALVFAIAGFWFVLFVIEMVLAVFPFLRYLKTGSLHFLKGAAIINYVFMHWFPDASLWQWLQAPNDWLGVHDIVEWLLGLPLAVSLAVALVATLVCLRIASTRPAPARTTV